MPNDARGEVMVLIQTAGVVLVVRRVPRRQILSVTNRAFGGISLPGGKAYLGESVRRAAARELFEETTLRVEPIDLTFLASGFNVRAESTYGVTLFFARSVRGQPENIESGTHFEWVTFEELLDVSPFRAFYARHMPDGIDHLQATLFDGSTHDERG